MLIPIVSTVLSQRNCHSRSTTHPLSRNWEYWVVRSIESPSFRYSILSTNVLSVITHNPYMKYWFFTQLGVLLSGCACGAGRGVLKWTDMRDLLPLTLPSLQTIVAPTPHPPYGPLAKARDLRGNLAALGLLMSSGGSRIGLGLGYHGSI